MKRWTKYLLFALTFSLLCLSVYNCDDEESGLVGITPSIGLSLNDNEAEALDFGQVYICKTAKLATKVTNTGTARLEIGSVSVEESGDEYAEFSTDVEKDVKLELEPRDFHPMLVSYTPKNLGTDEGTISITNNSDKNPFTVDLKGEGVAPDIQVCAVDGGECNKMGESLKVTLNKTVSSSPPETLCTKYKAVNNSSEKSIALHSIQRDLGVTQEFTVKPTIANLTLAPEESVEFEVCYSPKDGGEDLGIIIIDSDQCPLLLEITAKGKGPKICPDPLPVLDFGDVPVGAASKEKIIFENCGIEDDLTITEIKLIKNSREYFSVGAPSKMPKTLKPGEKLGVEVTYGPKSLGPDDGSVSVKSNDPSAPEGVISIRGNGVQSTECDLDVIPRLINVGMVAPNYESRREVKVVNVGQKPCVVTGIDDPIPGSNTKPGEFSLDKKPQLPLTIAPGQFNTFEVVYKPVDINYDEGVFHVKSNDPFESDLEIKLKGEGSTTAICKFVVEPASTSTISQTDGELNFGQVNLHTAKVKQVFLKNIGTIECTIKNATYTPPSGLICTIGGSSGACAPVYSLPNPAQFSNVKVSPGQKAKIDVQYKPTTKGVFGGATGGTGLTSKFLLHRLDIITDDLDFTSRYKKTGPTAVNPAKGTFVVALLGQAVEADIDIIPDEIDAGTITLNCNSPDQCIKIYNTGNAILTISNVRVEPPGSPFRITKAAKLPIQLKGGESTEICVRYKPAKDGTDSGFLVVESDDGNEPEVKVPMKGKGTTETHQKDIFDQLDKPKVDVLFIIDNSGSMGDEQSSIATNFSMFMQEAQQAATPVDFQMGVISTEVNDSRSPDKAAGHSMDIEPGVLWGDPTIINSSHSDPVSAFQKNVKIGTCCSDEQEAGLQAAKMALSMPIIEGKNKGFLREDAKLSIIMVSDEEDQSNGPVDLYIDFFKSIKGFRNDSLMDVSVICGLPNDPSCTSGSVPHAEVGARYVEVADKTGGLKRSICSSNWGKDLADLGVLTFGVKTEFILTRMAVSSSLKVTVNNQPMTMGTDYDYDPNTNSIIFKSHAIPPKGAKVSVSYDVACNKN